MTTLITGATGFLARHLASHLAERVGHDSIVLVSRSSTAGMVQCDFSSEAAVRTLIRDARPRTIYHLGASFTEDFDESFRANVLAARNLLESVANEHTSTRVVLMGSAAEYGIVGETDNPISESHPLRPCSIYGWSKAAQTQLAMAYAQSRAVDVVVARLFNIVGEGAPERLFVGRVLSQIELVKAGRARRVSVGALDGQRDYLDVKRACELLELVAARGTSGEVYNVGSGKAVRIRELLGAMLNAKGMDWSVIDEQSYRKPGGLAEVTTIYADTRKLISLTAGDARA